MSTKKTRRTVFSPPVRTDLTGKTAWHYTTGNCLLGILSEEVIRPATTFVSKRERTATWFTLANDWEETANKSLLKPDGSIVFLDREQTRQRAGGLFRIGIDAGTLCDWHAYTKHSGVNRTELANLTAAAVEAGSVPERDWLVLFNPVSRALWTAVEVQMETGNWASIFSD